MPNTRADLERLKHHWEHDHGAWEPEHGDEMIALCERLLEQRDNLRTELIERCETMERMATGGPCWLTMLADDDLYAPAIHFRTDADLIYGTDDKPQEGEPND